VLKWNKETRQFGSFTIFAPIFATQKKNDQPYGLIKSKQRQTDKTKKKQTYKR
jgi:hypothetical protein